MLKRGASGEFVVTPLPLASLATSPLQGGGEDARRHENEILFLLPRVRGEVARRARNCEPEGRLPLRLGPLPLPPTA
jgi:hypothetical protein